MEISLSIDHQTQLRRLKQYFPFRIVWGMIDKDTGEFAVYADTTKRKMNKMVRAGHHVFLWS